MNDIINNNICLIDAGVSEKYFKLVLLMQKSAGVREAEVEGVAIAVGTCKISLNRS